MPDLERVTVTLPGDLIRHIDRQEKNRSKFVAEAVRRELDRRRRDELRKSLENPHAEIPELAGQGLAEWAAMLPEEDCESLVDTRAGKAVRWAPGEGWVVDSE
jgi:Arc/MetJ-type ribon-helix-helix transcriptional regulator